MDYDSETSPAIPALSSDNYTRWFNLVKTTFEAKDIEYVLTQGQDEYSLTAQFDELKISEAGPSKGKGPDLGTESKDSSQAATPASSASSGTRKVFNPEKNKQWKKDNAKAKIIVLKALGEFDYDAVSEHTSVKEIWAYLQKRNYDDRDSVGLSSLQALVTYKKSADMSITDAWIDIGKIKARLAQSDSTMAKSFGQEQKLMLLFQGLPDEYMVLKDTFQGS